MANIKQVLHNTCLRSHLVRLENLVKRRKTTNKHIDDYLYDERKAKFINKFFLDIYSTRQNLKIYKIKLEPTLYLSLGVLKSGRTSSLKAHD